MTSEERTEERFEDKYVIIKSKKDVERVLEVAKECAYNGYAIYAYDRDRSGVEWYWFNETTEKWNYKYNRCGAEPMHPIEMTEEEVRNHVWKERKQVNDYTKDHDDNYNAAQRAKYWRW